jgi:hypothetical protein
MGVTILNALALLEARAEGASFERTLTLGRVAGFLSPKDLARIARALPPESAFAKSVVDLMTRRAGGAVRLLRRMHVRGKWRRQSRANLALKAHEWPF